MISTIVAVATSPTQHFGTASAASRLFVEKMLADDCRVGVSLAGALTPAGLAFLQYPEGWAGVSILLIETAATLSIAATLALAYLGGRPAGFETPSEAPPDGRQEN